MKTIPLTQGKVALVDDEDFERLSKFKWQALCMNKHSQPIWYARRMTSLRDGPRRAVYMHREIIGATAEAVDHKDSNGLNNQKHNLSDCGYGVNAHRRRKRSGTHSRFYGVTWNKGEEKWMASIKCGGIGGTLGYFAEEEDAAIAYNVAAQLFFGEYARLNDV